MLKQLARRALHTAVYHLLIRRSRGRILRTRAARLDLTVPPGVFHPKWFLSSEMLARYVSGLDLSGKRVVDIGTGSGILAISAARAGAKFVAAVDVNPDAVGATRANARQAGYGGCVSPFCGDLLGAVSSDAMFDVALSNPPFFPGEPVDIADRAWHAGPAYRDITALFDQILERLAPDGRAYVVLSTDADLPTLTAMMERAGFEHRVVRKRRLVFESLIIYELSRGASVRAVTAQPIP